MSKAIGFRVEGKNVHWAIVAVDRDSLILEDSATFTAPRGVSEGSALTYIRERVGRILEQHTPDFGAVKYTEPTARSSGDGPRARARIEGVILQRIDEAGVDTLGGAYNVISPRLGTTSAKDLLTNQDLRGLAWGNVPSLQKEAILAAAAALKGFPWKS